MNKTYKTMVVLSVISFFIAVVMMATGYDKIYNYDSGDSYPYETHNAYVGGDAYNFIINAGYANGYFTQALIFVVSGFGFLVVGYLSRITSTVPDSKNP
jgi:hypothetical protein